MDRFVIHGETPLRGEVNIRGSKNAATPILAATLLTKEPCIIDNLPLVEDVFRMIELLESVGVKITWLGKRKIKAQALDINAEKLNQQAVRQLRSSVLLLAPLLARTGKITFPTPGGCIIGARPLDTHFAAFQDCGVKIKETNENYQFEFRPSHTLPLQKIVLREFSVTATENIIMLASTLEQKTYINLAAAEPHVQDLIDFLQKMGVQIEGSGTHHLIVTGKRRLNGASHRITPDYLEAGTFLIAAIATKGRIVIKDVRADHLEATLAKLKEMNAKIQIQEKKGKMVDILVTPSFNLKSARIQALPYPGLPTDLQALFGVLATQANGTSLIHDPLYEGRLRYVMELNKMGANCLLADAHRAFIVGPTPLYGKPITSFDIRAGATLIIAGLVAKGKTTIDNAYQVDRGYEKIEHRLRKLGADIKRIKV